MGPGTVTRDRFDYAGSVGESWKTQMLLNLVKIRYGDIPVFLDVGQVVAGYSMQRTARWAGCSMTGASRDRARSTCSRSTRS